MIFLVGLLGSPVTTDAAQAAPLEADLAEEAQLHFTLGLQAYRARKFPTALAHLLQSNRLAPNSNTAFNVALCYDRLAQPAQAWRFYAASLQGTEADRDAEAAMARLAPLIGRLSIDSDPPGARVYVGRRDLGERGTTPLVLALKPGHHELIVEYDGYLPVQFGRELEGGDADSVAVPLTPGTTPREERWMRSTVTYDGEVIVVAEPEGCSWLPSRGSLDLGTAAPAIDAVPAIVHAPGSRLLVDHDVDFALDVTVSGRDGVVTTRTRLGLTRSASLEDATEVRQWALPTCTRDAGTADASATTARLQGLPKSLRRATVAVLAELAPAMASDAAISCGKGSCRRFVEALLVDAVPAGEGRTGK